MMWSKWIFITVILAVVLVQLINAANQQQRRQPQRARPVARRAANTRARQVHAAHRTPVRRAPVAARKAPARPASHPVHQTPARQQSRKRSAPKQAAKRKAPPARRDEDGGADGQQFTNNGPYFSLPVVLGSQKAKVNVGVEGVYGASVIYGPKVLCSGCPRHATFDREASTSFKVEVSNKNFSFSLGTAIADAGEDYMSVGSMELNPTMFAVATKIPNHLHYKTKNSGHLAMWGPEDDEPMKTTMQKLVELNDNKIVTFYAPVNQNGMHAITFGREDTTHCKSNWATFDNVPVVVDNPDDKEKSPWIMNMECVRWGSYVQHGTTRIALNVGSNYFVAPRRDSEHISNMLGATYSNTYYGNMVDCSKRNTAPDLEFIANGRSFKVSANEYIKMYNSRSCLINIYPNDDDAQWEWEVPYMFHQRHCVKYDYGAKQISLADPM